ncbi:MAG: polysaccharide biosynthesis protein [Magnetococcales bacterium]|nr:polysaccharide biosynthesis protein [Magnetococcales bacterium]
MVKRLKNNRLWREFSSYLLTRSRRTKQFILLYFDMFAILTSIWGGFAIRYDVLFPEALRVGWVAMPLAIIVSFPVFHHFGLYRAIVRFMEAQAVFGILKAVTLSVLLTVVGARILDIPLFSPAVWLPEGMLLLILVGGSRVLVRFLLVSGPNPARKRIPVAVYGAGDAGVRLVNAIKHSVEVEPLFFIDDNKEIQGHEVLGMPVHAPRDLPDLVRQYGVQRIMLAMPSVNRVRRSEIIRALEDVPAQVMVVPDLGQIASGNKKVEDVEQVGIEDLLERTPVQPNRVLMEACIRGKSVLVTGAGGSIGSELCRKILHLAPKRLVLVERTEFALYTIEQELRRILDRMPDKPELIPILGSTEHRKRMQSVIESFEVRTIYHAAAYKHVPIIERNPIEGVQNNIFGTLHLAEAANAAGVETFVLISTDKAVRPTNVMGATKRFTELILQGLAQLPDVRTRFIAVRFGNVLASSGSVVPLFRDQIKRGGPVTVTHRDVERFFMTISEAAELVIQAGSMGRGGDVFVLNMGKQVRIDDFARRMIRLAGLTVKDENNPQGDIEITYTGLREGEKLYEELLIGNNLLPTEHEMILHAQEESFPWERIQRDLARLSQASKDFSYQEILKILEGSVSGYQPAGGVQDWVWIHKAQ